MCVIVKHMSHTQIHLRLQFYSQVAVKKELYVRCTGIRFALRQEIY